MKQVQRFFILILLLLVQQKTVGQNLVPNAGFEEFSSCPDGDSDVELANPWFSPNDNLADYFNECSENLFYTVPNNEFGNQMPNGKGYMGIHTYFFDSGFTNRREFVSVPLNQTLVAGNEYCISFKVSLAEESQFSIDAMGLLLSDVNPSGMDFLSENPQIVYLNSEDLKISSDWLSISESYIAMGGESYLTIGNFKDDLSTLVQFVNPNGFSSSAYYFIDDVMVLESIAQNIDIDLGKNDTICEPSVTLSPGEGFARYTWQDGTNNDSYQARETGWYSVVVEDACGNTKRDSVLLSFKNCIEECLQFPNAFSPNGDNVNDQFRGRACEVNDLRLQIFNRWGELIFTGNDPQIGWDGTYNGELQPIGTYLWATEYIDPQDKPQTQRGYVVLLR